jgi:hypothetical protein
MGCDNTADTNAAMDELKLKPGQQAYTLSKASDVLIAAIERKSSTGCAALMNSRDSSYHTSEAAG